MFYSFIPLLPGRGPTPRQGGDRNLHVNKYNFFCTEAPGGSLPPPCRASGLPPRAAGRPPARQAARPAGGRQAPPKYKS